MVFLPLPTKVSRLGFPFSELQGFYDRWFPLAINMFPMKGFSYSLGHGSRQTLGQNDVFWVRD